MEKETATGAAATRHDDPWYEAAATGWGGPEDAAGAVVADGRSRSAERRSHSGAEIYLEVQNSPAFREVRRRYRRFVIPAAAAFLLWYLVYVIAATTAHDLMARPVVGALNVAMVAGLGQFLTTFLLTWAYARHARLHRDRAALELRWETQEMTRGNSR
ncbi:DUF485 domain-containing protein [Streptomyces sp. NPDC005794]|uniref:DUF485 domain-containing protein n=1 Tax=Streptomyces sp. NPDC005794 TaxID=3364733 RepID=UPI0036A89C96